MWKDNYEVKTCGCTLFCSWCVQFSALHSREGKLQFMVCLFQFLLAKTNMECKQLISGFLSVLYPHFILPSYQVGKMLTMQWNGSEWRFIWWAEAELEDLENECLWQQIFLCFCTPFLSSHTPTSSSLPRVHCCSLVTLGKTMFPALFVPFIPHHRSRVPCPILSILS